MPAKTCRKCRGTGRMICPLCGGKGVAFRKVPNNPERQKWGVCPVCGGLKIVPCDNLECSTHDNKRPTLR